VWQFVGEMCVGDVHAWKNTNESASAMSSTCVVPATFSYQLHAPPPPPLDAAATPPPPPPPYFTALGPAAAAAALSYVPLTVPPAGAHLAPALPLPAPALIAADYAGAVGAGGGQDAAYSYSSTSSFALPPPPTCLRPMFFASETSFQLSTCSRCPSDANLSASQVSTRTTH